MGEPQGYIYASYEEIVQILGEPTVFYEWTFEGYDIYGEEIDITISGDYKDGVMWKVVSKDPCAMQIVQNKIDQIYCEIITEKKVKIF